jgi:hypothetical protein
VEVEIDVASVAHENTVLGVDAIGFELCDFLEEARNVDDATSANEVDAAVGKNSRCCRVSAMCRARYANQDNSRRMCTSKVLPFFTIV